VKQQKRRSRTAIVVIALLTVSSLLVGCGGEIAEDTVYLASVGPESRINGEFGNGVAMALEEINQGDYLVGKTIAVETFDDNRDLTTGIKIAQKLAEQRDKYSAVIGHWNASISIPSSTIYNDAGLLTISPMVSSPELTQPAKQHIFRAVPTDADEARKIAEYAAEKGYRNIAICYTQSDYGTGLTKEFVLAGKELGIEIIDIHSDFVSQAEFDKQYSKWEALDIEAVFVADSLPYAIDLIHRIRAKDASLPILSAGGFSFDNLVELAGEDGNQVAYVALYYPGQQLETQIEFNRKYQEKYGEEPTSFLASKGYELIYLIADAVKETGSVDSRDLADYLRGMEPWKGVLDEYHFDENGDPQDMKLYIVEVNDGTYTYL
jgi:branched-chain amino acid transport system substrate-binding protein